MKIWTLSLIGTLIALDHPSAHAIQSQWNTDTRLNCPFDVTDRLLLQPEKDPQSGHLKIVRVEGPHHIQLKDIQDLNRKVSIRTGAEALAFVRLRTVFNLPSKSDHFRGYELISTSQVTRQIAFGVRWIFDQMQDPLVHRRFGAVPDIWFKKNRLTTPIVKGLGYRWSISRFVLESKPDHSFQPGTLDETVDLHGVYHATFTPNSLPPPPQGWGQAPIE